ncbi:hydrolase [Flexivirga sp. ID2601S]|uniref:Hydrolase n=1 Tax=Flexivirga aerilata TaxID=1656889 RepID=A0A849ACU1_9MICO|nr:acyl-CoA dehydrogenase family protein [Flexivirga aerilata]NNG38289.1 hydrolase [Flexivirga aerilata]
MSAQLDTQRLAGTAAATAAAADRNRALDDLVVREMVDAGITRHFVPAEYGGTAGSHEALLDAVLEVSSRCASAGWVASVLAYSARFGRFLPPEGQAELWTAGPDSLVAGALVPGGTAVATGDTWHVAGRWSYVSAAPWAQWVFACVNDGDDPLFALLPRDQFRVETDWDTVGMRGTASHTIVVADSTVPSYRTFRRSVLLAGATPSRPIAPLRAVSGLTFAAPVAGAGRGALADLLDSAKRPPSPQVAWAAGELDAADLLLRRAATVADHSQDGTVQPGLAARSLRDTALAAQFVAAAIARISAAAGSSGQHAARPIARFTRDVQTAVTHVALRFDTAAAPYLSSLHEAPYDTKERTP